ncbi:hypothetical protein B0H66DRAFT_565967 [Apodospora peruviana]|uniref:DUF8021 domain-containing protein n=1 Tax=Apodospora peruviana TaxID=516989 RepID=A0AAE0LZG6_9PEZI|nr:hypothetical protein B0H66DRAFT_565967 [Apodospora peruviana]
MVRPNILTLTSLLLGLLPSTTAQAQACQWGSLRQMTDTFIESLTYGELDPSLELSSISYRENDKPFAIGSPSSILSKGPLQVDFTHTIIDQPSCASFTKLVVTDPKTGPYVIATQLFYNATSDAELTTNVVDVVVTTKGDYQFDASQTLEHVMSEDWAALDRDQLDDREVLQGVADAYLDLWSGGSLSAVPFGRPCSKLEGSRYTADSCTAGLNLPSGDGGMMAGRTPNTNRRYVIDQSVGAVSVFCSFGSLGGAPDSHEFRVLGGKLVYVHQIVAAAA